ncbi:MAG: hypothetical protein JXB17_02185 [Bacteroidales bacterium]|nr:hypothetical protein [Bacteroidales bacterium]
MKKILKRIIYGIILLYYKMKCELYYFLFGGEGLSTVIENMPKFCIKPILRKFGAHIGNNSNIDRGLILHKVVKKKDIKKIRIGDRVHIGRYTLLDLSADIFIDSDTALGAFCQIWTHTGNWTLDREDEHNITNPVTIGKAVICYSGVTIGQNVKIGNFARVGAGSVVIRDVKEKTLVGGVTAKFIKNIEHDN